jgi:hypothetical protein
MPYSPYSSLRIGRSRARMLRMEIYSKDLRIRAVDAVERLAVSAADARGYFDHCGYGVLQDHSL